METFLEALSQASHAYGRHGGISHKLLLNEFMDLIIGSFHRNGSKPPNNSKERGEYAGFLRFFNLEASHGGLLKCLQMPPIPIA